MYSWYMINERYTPVLHLVYTKSISGIYQVVGAEEVQGPIPADPSAITSPGLVIMITLFEAAPLHLLLFPH